MNYSISPKLDKELRKIKLRQPQLYNKVRRVLLLFQKDLNHPSLNTHKLKGNLSDYWSIYVDDKRRLIYSLKENEAVFFRFGSHNEAYREN